MVRLIAFSVLALCAATPVLAQQEKAEINITNSRREQIVMRFDYAFRDYSWRIMEHAIPAQDDITYRYPSNIPGCEKLHEWGIADGILTISNAGGTLCQKRLSLCDKTLMFMDVQQTQCTWKERKSAAAQ